MQNEATGEERRPVGLFILRQRQSDEGHQTGYGGTSEDRRFNMEEIQWEQRMRLKTETGKGTWDMCHGSITEEKRSKRKWRPLENAPTLGRMRKDSFSITHTVTKFPCRKNHRSYLLACIVAGLAKCKHAIKTEYVFYRWHSVFTVIDITACQQILRLPSSLGTDWNQTWGRSRHSGKADACLHTSAVAGRLLWHVVKRVI